MVTDSRSTSPELPTTPRPIARQIAPNAFIPVIYRPSNRTEWERFQPYPRKAKTTADAALRYAQRRIYFEQLRTNEARRRLAAISGSHWLGVVASMDLRPLTWHRKVNRDRTGYDGWGR